MYSYWDNRYLHIDIIAQPNHVLETFAYQVIGVNRTDRRLYSSWMFLSNKVTCSMTCNRSRYNLYIVIFIIIHSIIKIKWSRHYTTFLSTADISFERCKVIQTNTMTLILFCFLFFTTTPTFFPSLGRRRTLHATHNKINTLCRSNTI